MRAHRRTLDLAAAGALTVLLAGCSSGVLDQDAPPAVVEVWRSDAPLIATALVDGVAIGYTEPTPGGYELAGWDEQTGEQLWSRPTASHLDSAPSIYYTDAGVTAVLSNDDGSVRVDVLDARTGDELGWGDRGPVENRFESAGLLWDCTGDDDSPTCFTGIIDGTRYSMRIDGSGIDGGFYDSSLEGATTFSLDNGISLIPSTQQIMYATLRTSWLASWPDAMGFPIDQERIHGRVLSDETAGVVVIAANPSAGADSYVYEQEVTAAFDMTTGALLWQTDAAACSLDTEVLLLCDDTGTRSDEAVDYASRTILAVEPRTGAELWSQAFDDDMVALANDPDALSWLQTSATNGVLMLVDGMPSLIDAADGTVTPLPDDVPLPCYDDGTVWCDAAGAPIESPELVDASFPGWLDDDGATVLRTPTGFVGYALAVEE